MKTTFVKYASAFALIIMAAASRLLPHPLNFTPVAAIALFGGVYLDKRLALAVPLAAMLLSDYFIGFYSGIYWVYGSFLLIGGIGVWMKSHKKPLYVLGGTLASSVLFFVVTNFGVWATPNSMYPGSWAGLMECYAAAIPFFRNTISGDFFFVTVMFGSYELFSALMRRVSEKTAVAD